MTITPNEHSEQILANVAATLAAYQARQTQIQTESDQTREKPAGIVQPDANGEFPTPADGAIWMAVTYGIPQTPLKGKRPFLEDWPSKASVDPVQIHTWAAEYPGCNFGSVAVLGRHFIFEADSAEVRERFKMEYPGRDFTSRLVIQSSGPTKGHRYYLHAPGVENVGQNKGEDFSIRADGEQCVSPGSIHPTTGKQYRVVAHDSPLTQPTAEEILFWKSQRIEKKSALVQANDEPIPQGRRNSTITSILGKARQQNGLKYDALLALARQHNQRCVPPLDESELETIAGSVARYSVKPAPDLFLGGKNLGQQETTAQSATQLSEIPIVDDPSDNDPRFEMKGDHFDTKVYEDISQRFTPYPNPGENDLVSALANKLVHGTSIPLAYVREPLKAIVLHRLDGKLNHPAHPKLSLRGNYFSLGESETGKTTGLEFALAAAEHLNGLANPKIHVENLFRYKSETTFIRSFTPEGTIKRDKDGVIKSGHGGNPSQFLYIKEGNLVANSSDYFAAVFAQLINLYDQTEAGTESMTNGDFTAPVVKASTVMCFTPSDFKATFGGKGTIGGGGLSRWGLVNPEPIHDYDDKDWERLDRSVVDHAIEDLTVCIFELLGTGQIVVLEEEPQAQKIRLEVKAMLRKAGKMGNRLMDYFMREQVLQAAVAVDNRLVMTAEQARYAKRWVEAQIDCRMNCWPSDSANQIESMEHAIRKAVTTHHVSETKLKDACHFYREGSGGWFVFSTAVKNAVASEAIKLTGKTRKAVKTFCPGSCAIHQALKEEKSRKQRD